MGGVMKRKANNLIIRSVIISGTCLTASPVLFAQGTLEEIIVTATKRERSMQDVPITMSAISGDSLDRLGIKGMDSLAVSTPGLFFGRSVGGAVILLRGVGTANAAAGNEPSVATYIDGVYNPNANANVASFNDIERIEVLKGPQGTLFGRNATGGLIHIITKDPTQEPEAKLKVGYGNYDTFESGFYGSTGLTENTAASISVYHKNQGEAPVDNPLPGREFLPDEDLSIRGKWLYTPSEQLEIKLTGFYLDYESSAFTARQPKPGVIAQGGGTYTGDYYKIANDLPTSASYEQKGANAQIRYSFGSVDLISITSWADDSQFTPFDNDGTGAFIQDSYGDIQAETQTQELRLVSTNDSKLDWILGLYYFDNSTSYEPLRVELPVFGGLTLNNFAEQDVKSWAAFSEGTYALTERTSLTLGLRWNEDDLDYSGNSFSTFGTIFPPTTRSQTFKKSTYRVTLNHNFTDSLMAYASYSRGYKTGLFNLINLGGPPAPAIRPEILDALEIGFKSDGWADGRVRLNGAAFYYDYQDLQVVTIGTASLSTTNAAATIYGVELDINAQVTDRLSLMTGMALNESEYDEYVGFTNRPAPSGFGNVAVSPVDFAGNELQRAPPFTFNASLYYTVPTEMGEFSYSLMYYHNGGFYWDEDNRVEEPAYNIVNTELSWMDSSMKYKVSLWGRNILEEEYSIYTNNSPSSGDAYTPGERRMYGVRVEYNFF